MKRLTLLLALVLFSAAYSYAQDNGSYQTVPVEISEVRAERGGAWFYVHKVLPKQTMYSICRAYDVTQQEVYEANRDALETGLKAGMELYIPFHGEIEPAAENNQQEVAQNVQTETVAEPVLEVVSEPQPQNDNGFTTHRVKWYETVYSIARKYEITPESIIRANSLKTVQLRTGQILKIPAANYQSAVEKQVSGEFSQQDIDDRAGDEVQIVIAEDESQPENDDFFFNEPFSGKARIALLLPFSARSSSPSSNYLDFYSGVLLALEKIKSQGVDVDLKVIDLAEYPNLASVATDAMLGDRDYVIGPVMSADIAKVIDYCNLRGIPLISPMDQQAEKLVEDNPSLVQTPVSAENQMARLIQSMRYSSPAEDNVLVIHEKGTDTVYFKGIEAALKQAGIPYKTFSYGILEGRNIDGTLRSSYLNDRKTNHVIIASEKESFASDAIRNISLLSTTYDIVGYGSNRMRNFETIELEAYQNVNMHFSIGYYVDYTLPEVKDFVFKYRALFNTEPGAYAFQGYDIVTYFTSALKTFGRHFTRSLVGYDMKLLQSNMHFEKPSPWGGYVNKATRDIVYLDDYSIACE